ncbi:MAG: cysteine desulfurase family protein [Clostridiaceae bacterium]
MIYADNAATTKMSELAFAKMLPFFQEQYGNASSQYSLGVKAKRAVEHSRRQVAEAIGAQLSEITFTSGGSEANSWVLRGVTDSFKGESIHIITTQIEHHSVLNACHTIESMGVEVTYLPVGNDGVIDIKKLIAAIKSNTKLVSVMLANNEIGTIQPVAEIGAFLHERGIWLHTDAVQAVGHIPVNVADLCVDLLSASAHKFNGAKGTGFLYMRSGISLPNLVFGGEQEHGYRAGTENVAGIVGAGFALEESVKDMPETADRLQTMIRETVTNVQERIPTARVNGNSELRLPGTVNLGFDGVSGEALMNLLDLKGICVSTSSACNSGKSEPSHVLLALGLNEEQAQSAIRISYGRFNTANEAKAVATAICEAYDKIKGSQAEHTSSNLCYHT